MQNTSTSASQPQAPAPTLLTHDVYLAKADAILELYIDHNIQQDEAFDALHKLQAARIRQMNGV